MKKSKKVIDGEAVKSQKPQKEKALRRTMIGGQALMEGVMMRGSSAMAMAVRAPEGNIMLETKRLGGRKWYNKVPLVRGVVAFVMSLITGVSTLMRSAEVSTPDEDTPSKGWMAFAVILGVVFSVGLFIILPSVLEDVFFTRLIDINERVGKAWGVLISSLFEGLLRILIFVAYLLLVSRMKDIRRTFMYHGAEHRTINCYEKGLDMTVENVQNCSTRHNRCGTTFLFFVMIISILVFSLVNWLIALLGWDSFSNGFLNTLVKVGTRLALLPLVAGLSFELLRGMAMLPDNTFTNILRAPGLALQRLTTYPPEDEMAEVALKSFLAVLNMDEDKTIEELKFGEYRTKDIKEYLIFSLKSIGLERREAEAEADWILCNALGVKRNELRGIAKINLGQYKKVNEIIDRRKAGEPLDYIFGESEFFGLRVKVTCDTLIPRMETELLCEKAIAVIGEAQSKTLDMCTGSGCVSLVLAKNTLASITAVDISEKALDVAKINCEKMPNVSFLLSDMFSNVEGVYDVIVANPPYIASGDIDALASDVKRQPRLALDGGEDGLEFYRRLADGLEFLADGGTMLMEIGDTQAASVREIFENKGINKEDIFVYDDLDGNNRVLLFTKR